MTATPESGTRTKKVQKVALLTAGGLAPCLSAAVAALVQRYTEVAPDVEVIGYRDGYHGLLSGRSVPFTAEARERLDSLYGFGGSPLGNSRVKLTNTEDLVKRGLINENQNALQAAAKRLVADGVDVLHTIGGDDTNTTAADLAKHLADNGYDLTVVGMPKTIDNDIVPISQSLGAWTAVEQAALFARNVLAEHSANPRMLIVHEVMGRACGWLTASAAATHHGWVAEQQWNPAIGHDPRGWDVHAVYVPELGLDIEAEAERLDAIMDTVGCVNVFVSEGAATDEIVADLKQRGENIPTDPFGHVKLDKVNAGSWLAEQLSGRLDAEKSMVQKSGYFSRSAAAGERDLALIKACAVVAVEAGLNGVSGVTGQDEENGDELGVIDFGRIKGGKPFDPSTPWFAALLDDLGQPATPRG